ncbi:MAG: hypothetical protein MZU97_14400 [Bacillus subtilis]|nr:hypothetical protein [Bacillus subtilis]
MRNNIVRNVVLQKGETVQKDFKNLKAVGTYCAMMLTTKRLIVSTFGPDIERGKRIRRRKMDEIELRSIHRFEYFLDYHRVNAFVRILGLIFFIAGAGAGYLNYTQALATYLLIVGTLPQLVLCLRRRGVPCDRRTCDDVQKQEVSGSQGQSGPRRQASLRFTPEKQNEEALRFIAGKIHID